MDSDRVRINCNEYAFIKDPKNIKIVFQNGVRKNSRNIGRSGNNVIKVLACGAVNEVSFLLSLFLVKNM